MSRSKAFLGLVFICCVSFSTYERLVCLLECFANSCCTRGNEHNKTRVFSVQPRPQNNPAELGGELAARLNAEADCSKLCLDPQFPKLLKRLRKLEYPYRIKLHHVRKPFHLTKLPSLLLPVADTIKQQTQQSGRIHKGFLHQPGELPHPCIPKCTETRASGAVVTCTAVRVPWVQ